MQEEDLVCIRHGRSGFNQGQVDFFNKNPHLKYPQAQQNESFRSQVLFSPKFIDTRLTPEGISQCQTIKYDQSFDKVKVVLVSPLTRALQSAKIIFGHRKIPMVVHPQLSQSFRYSCDLSQPIDNKKAQFPEFDYAHLKGYEPHWQISRNLGLKNCESLKKVLQNHSHLSFQKQQKEICRLVGLRHFYESNQELIDRSRRMRRKLEEYRKQYTTVGVVAHLWALRYLVSSEFDRNCMPAQVLELQNARPYWFSFAKLGLKRL